SDQSSTSSSPSPTDRHTSDRMPAAATTGTRSRRGIRARRLTDLAAAFAGRICALAGALAAGRTDWLAVWTAPTGRSEAPPQRARWDISCLSITTATPRRTVHSACGPPDHCRKCDPRRFGDLFRSRQIRFRRVLTLCRDTVHSPAADED